MTDTNKLNELINNSGYKKRWISEQIGLSRYGLSLKINNKNQFTAAEIQKLCEILNIDNLEIKDKIFFA